MKYSNNNKKKNNKNSKNNKNNKNKFNKDEDIWYKNLAILFHPDYFSKAYPEHNHSLEEKFNAIMRLSIYITIILVVITGNFNYLLIILFVAIITYLIHLNIDHYEDKKIEKVLKIIKIFLKIKISKEILNLKIFKKMCITFRG